MNYKNRLDRLLTDMIDVIERHMSELKEAESGGFDIDDVLDMIEKDIETKC